MLRTFLLAKWEAKRDIQWAEFCAWLDKEYPLRTNIPNKVYCSTTCKMRKYSKKVKQCPHCGGDL